MRIGGLASGIDTDSIIRDMMNANRIPLTKITQKKQYLDWQVNDFRAVNRQLNDFSTNIWEKLLQPTTSGFRKTTVEVSSPDAVSIKAAGADNLSGSIEVHALAKSATLQGDKLFTPESNVSKEEFDQMTLADLGSWTSITITAPGKDAVKLDFNTTDTLKSVLQKINSQTDVNAFYDSHTGKIAMTAKESGVGKIVVDGELGEALKLSESHVANGSATFTSGQNADFTFNGLRTERASNSFEIGGFEVTLKQVTTEAVNFSSKADSDEIFNTVVNFVNEYNKLIEDLNGQIREPKYRNYQPLSADEKADMKENEIKLWEEKAMSGTLRNDPTITNMLLGMRTALMGPIGEKGGPSLKDLGITTSKDYMDNGKLIINEEALKKAISEDPKKVEAMFTSNVKGAPENEKGFAIRVREIVQESQGTITNKAGSIGFANETFSLGRTLKDMDKQIERFEDRLKMVEDRLWRQFSAMEAAINRANAQSAQLMNSLGGGM